MKKRIPQVLACFFAAGILAATGLESIKSYENVKTETIEFTVEENERYGLHVGYGTLEGTVTNYSDLSSFEASLPHGYGFKRVSSIGFDGQLTLVAQPGSFVGNKHSYHVAVYAKVQGQNVKCIGEIKDLIVPLAYKDGVLYGLTSNTIETYVVSKDGSQLMFKDFADKDGYYGYTRKSNDISTTKEFSNDKQKFDEIYYDYWDNAEDIEFTIK